MKSILKYIKEISQLDYLSPNPSPGRIGEKGSQICLLSVGAALAGIFLFPSEALANIGVTLNFPNNQNNISGTQSTTLTITVRNGTLDPINNIKVETKLNLDTDLTINEPNLNALPNTCNGTASYDSITKKVILTGATINAQQTCTVTVNLKAGKPSNPKTYSFTIDKNSVTSSKPAPNGTNKDPASVTLTVSPIQAINGNISIDPGLIHGDGKPGIATITLNNTNTFDLNGANFELTLPKIPISGGGFKGLDFADIVGTTTCAGGQVTISNGKLIFTGGTIPQASNCTISFKIKPLNSSIFQDSEEYTIEIPGNQITTTEGISNSNAINGKVKVQSGARVTASFDKDKIISETTSKLRLKFENFNGTPITGADFENLLPNGVTITRVLSNNCGFNTSGVASDAADRLVKLENGTIPAAPDGPGAGSCQVEIEVTSDKVGNYPYNISAGNLNGIDYNLSSATLNVVAPVFVSMSFGESRIIQGDTVKLKYKLENRSLKNDASITNFINSLNLGTGYKIKGFSSGNTACGGGTLSLENNDTQFRLTGGTIPKNSFCEFELEVEASDTASVNNRTQTVTGGETTGQLVTNLGRNSEGASVGIFVGGRVRVSKAFSQSAVQGQSTTLTITLHNDYRKAPVNANITSFVDDLTTMGSGFTVGGTVTTTCGGDVSSSSVGGTKVQMTGGVIPMYSNRTAGSCTITVPIKIAFNANITKPTNLIKIDDLKTNNLGNNLFPATAELPVPAAVNVSAEFIEQKVIIDKITRLKLTFSRPNNGNPISDIELSSQSLPAGYKIASDAKITSTCGAVADVTAVADATTFSIDNGDLTGSKTTCEVGFDLVAPSQVGVKSLDIAKGRLKSQQGSTNEFAVSANVRAINPYLIINTSFDAATISPGGTSRLKIDILNGTPQTVDNFIDLTQVGLTNILPPDLFATNTPNPAFVGNGCTGGSGAVIVQPDRTQLQLQGAGIKAGSSCQIQIDVTSEYAGNLVNEIAKAAVISQQGITNRDAVNATLLLGGKADLEIISKDDGKTVITPKGTTIYTIKIRNNGPDNVAGVPVEDLNPTGMTINSWTCTATSGSLCNQTSGTGELRTRVRLIAQGEATFTVTATVNDNVAAGTTITNTAQVGPVDAVTDNNVGNNRKTDTNNVILGNPNVLLVKRITAVNGSLTTRDGDSLNGYINEPANPYDDNTIEPSLAPKPPTYPTKDTDKWPNPSTFLIGGINGGIVKPGDELEYTIYYISAGELPVKNARFCDRVPENATYIPTAFNASGNPTQASGSLPTSDRGIVLNQGGTFTSLTGVQDNDIGQYFPPGVDPKSVYPNIDCGGANTNGAVVVNLGELPGATSSGNPKQSYGFVRFRAKVK